MKQQDKLSRCKLHSVKFYNLITRGITHLSYNEQNYKLGVVRLTDNLFIFPLFFIDQQIFQG